MLIHEDRCPLPASCLKDQITAELYTERRRLLLMYLFPDGALGLSPLSIWLSALPGSDLSL